MKVLQILVLIFGLSVFVNAQTEEKLFVLSGTVFEPSKAVVVAADITADNKDGRKFKTISDKKGIYKLSIPFGEYTITFHKDGFIIAKFTNFENLSLPEKKLDVNLEITTCYDCGSLIADEDKSERKNQNEI